MNEKFMNGLLALAGKMQGNSVLSAIKDSFIDNMPVTITGAFATLFQFTLSATKAQGYDISLANVPGFGWLAGLWNMWGTINYGCMNFLAVAICVLVAMHFAENIGHYNDRTVPSVALASFVTLITTSVSGTVTTEAGEEVAYSVSGVVASSYTSANGLFVSLIVAILATLIYVKLVDSGKLKISLPDSVPPNVAQSFAVLLPAACTILVFGLLGFVMMNFFNLSFFAVIGKIMAPVEKIMTGLPGYLVVVFFIMLFWWFGIHGANVMSPVTTAFFERAYAANNALYGAGIPVKLGTSAVVNGTEYTYSIICSPFASAFFSHTGSGLTGGFIIAVLLFSKRDDYKAVAKLAIPCGIFNINEPIIFGIPMVMNPLMAVPFFVAPMASVTVGYILTRIGFCPVFVVNAPWTTPTGILGFLASGGKLMGGLSQLICIAVATLIYTPFVIAANAQSNSEEAAA